ncbi:Flp pilus assembly protein CpaB [Alcaligenaceae bacterium CGII-47]|nr:Flp pilus assembly protein CpaB [Alcaligenaceae bacterium CGII-47]
MKIRLSLRSMVLMGLALVSGAMAAWSVHDYIQGRVDQIEAQARVPMVERVVAAYDLPAGTRLQTEHMALRSFPREWVSSASLSAARYAELDDSVLVSSLRAGDPILLAHTVAVHQQSFSSQLAQGRRAITLPVDQINSVSGLLQPGDLIDLYVSFEYQRRQVTAPLLQGVLVLATGRTTRLGEDRAEGGYSTVTLDTAPEDAVKLVAARQSGQITAILRHPDDLKTDLRAVRGDLAALLGVQNAPPVPKKSPQVIYGNQSTRTMPGLRAQPKNPAASGRSSGLFDLPQAQDLVSAWMRRTAADTPLHDEEQ